MPIKNPTRRTMISAVPLGLLLNACGGGGGGGSESSSATSPPQISSLRYSPTSADATLGAITVSGSVQVATSSDLRSVRITNSRGGDQTVSIVNATGFREGRLSLPAASISGHPPGSFSFTVWVVDALGQESNRLTGSIAIQRISPIASAGGDRSVQAGSSVVLDGTKSTNTNGTSTGYSWSISQKSPDAQGFLEGANTATPTFTALRGVFQLQLIVNDGYGDSSPAFTKITAVPSGYFSIGSSESDVMSNQGSPVQREGPTWAYDSIGLTRVSFSSVGGEVDGWENSNGALRPMLLQGWQSTGTTGISTSATLDDVIRLQGTPVTYEDSLGQIVLGYDRLSLTRVTISKQTGLVTGWRNYNGTLIIQ